MQTRWIAGRRKPEAEVRFRLLCFSHAGGSSSLFARWRSAFGEDVEVCPVVLPGREARMSERSYHRMEELIGPLVEALMPSLNVPFALFGHSLGSIIAFEVARRASALGRPPEGLMVSGRRAPHLRARRVAAHLLDDKAFLRAVGRLNGTPAEVLQDEELMRAFIPSLRADFEVNDTYVPLPGRPLRCNIIAFMGSSDPEVNESELLAWRETTSGQFRHHVLEGDHFYLQAQPEPLLALVRPYLESYRGATVIAC
nr:surfactin synthase thioesterase subunit [uncultured bacterium]